MPMNFTKGFSSKYKRKNGLSFFRIFELHLKKINFPNSNIKPLSQDGSFDTHIAMVCWHLWHMLYVIKWHKMSFYVFCFYVFCHSLTPYPMQNIDPLGIGTNRGFLGKVFGITWLPFFPLIQMWWRLKIDINLKNS